MPVPEHIEDAAAIWVIRFERGLTGEEQDAFLEWLTADPRNGEEFNRQKANWSRLNLLADWRPEHGQRPNVDLLAPARAKPPRRHPLFLRRALWMTMAAAALVAVGFFLRPAQAPTRDIAAVAIAPAPAKPIAAIERRTLSDGSVLELNRGSSVSVAFTGDERRVRLESGETTFHVAKEAGRPFIVEAGGVSVRAVGTIFNVRLDPSTVDVLVTEGRILVQHSEEGAGRGDSTHEGADDANLPPASAVTAGQRAILSRAERAIHPCIASVTEAEIDRLLAWQPRLLDFADVTLDTVVAEFNRRNAPVWLRFADPHLARISVSATLRSDNIEGFLRLLESGFHISARREGHTITLQQH